MAHLAPGSVARQLESLFDGGFVGAMTDRQLLERFTARREADREAAFGALVARHGPTVMSVCRDVLRDRHDAEDAFQAVFLVLACKAQTIRHPESLGSWLHGVALRTARRQRILIGRLRRNEEPGAGNGPGLAAKAETLPPVDESAIAREHAEILRDEVERLPRRFRLPVVLCYFEGLALDEAARRLRWPAGTLRSRLARARDKLRHALVRRGVVLPSANFAAALSLRVGPAHIPFAVCELTARAAVSFATGNLGSGAVSVVSATLARGAMRSMLRHHLKIVASTLLILGAVATAASVLTCGAGVQDNPKTLPRVEQSAVASTRKRAADSPATGRMIVTGRVRDREGKPVPNAIIMVHARTKLPGRVLGRMGPAPIGHGVNDSSGGFQISALRTTSARHNSVSAVAGAPGYGAGWAMLDPDAKAPSADITLPPERVIHGRLFDVEGRPAPGVAVTVRALFRIARQTEGFVGEPEGQAFWMTHAQDSAAWPQPSTTDAEGRFTLRGVGRGTQVYVEIDDPRFARQYIDIDTGTLSDSKPLRLALEPAQIITGRVTYADSGEAVPDVWISISSLRKAGGATGGSDFQADANGRFRANPFSGDRFSVTAHSPDRRPYLSVRKKFDWPRGAIEQSIDLALPRGVPIRGRVTEEGSGQPVAGAAVRYIVQSKPDADPDISSSPAETSGDGSFEFAVTPEPGYLVIGGPSEDYLTREIGSRLLFEGQPGGRRVYGHAFIACDPKPGTAALDFNVVLRKGMALKGRVIGPDGEAVPDAWIFSRAILGPSASAWRMWIAMNHGHAREGRFELHRLDPATEYPVYFLEPNRKLGATARLSSKSAGGSPVMIRLEPCGAAKARLVDADGKPVAVRLRPGFVTMVVTRRDLAGAAQSNSGQLLDDSGLLNNVDPVNHANLLESNSEGQVEISALIPGATYRFTDRTAARNPGGPQVRREFRVQSGKTVHLGDIRIEKPQTVRIMGLR